MRQKAVLDTSFLIEHFRKGTVQDIFINLNKYYHITFSAIVLMELLSGSFDKKEQKLIEQIKKNFTVISVSEKQWYATGDVMLKLRRDKKIDSLRIRNLLADILIAVSVRDIGAILVTKNEKDFKLINEVLDFRYLAV
ncbi:PIN domain protein [Candidatus Kuenenia stuttgartiensis]|jgi:predicted nucleic acid-binding protein|uniref:PIN domain protein n=1 Tax=Kuenenia stuttgartiensis TaxID=174633 RepID=A0A2C9CD97_KUEST|nr:PIN domain-containing protein [Candidatus Kuenenia stuttgartiensis]MBZ0193184.1 PIN domain-containing protein [Candidatus Kuenenia stuttgartiensis]QII10329.1 PIN domain protein [Candidatus Kuenenia stuttgartiensis]SOH03839.1 PIN domain protein [Candidatus Kuenenia stuttgartiensis]